MTSLTLLLLLFGHAAQALESSPGVNFTEEQKHPEENSTYSARNKSIAKSESKGMDESDLIQGARNTFGKYNNRVRVPGFISASPISPLGRVVGPVKNDSILRMGDTIYVRWTGGPAPKPGERFATYSPAIVLQNLLEPTDFEVIAPPGPKDSLPKDRRLAGYFYETNTRLKVLRVRGDLVDALIEQMSNTTHIGDELMPVPPLRENIPLHTSGTPISAAVVSGSPANRLSMTRRSVIYINRGSRDGVRVGRVFEAIESVRLDGGISGAAPEISHGEAVVIHTTDSYSTAMISKQFDVIRIGSLLRSKQESSAAIPSSPFGGFAETKENQKYDLPDDAVPILPNLENPPSKSDESLPEPRKKVDTTPLSELDRMEKNMKLNGLSAQEKAKLDKLSEQEKLAASRQAEADEEAAGNPGAPTVENSFQDGKKGAKKDKKAKPRARNEEEDLNLLMQQN